MARYFFHVQREAELYEDADGSEDSSLEEAKAIARQSASEMVANALGDESNDAPIAIIIVQDGREVATVRLADVIPAKLKK